MDTTSIPKTGIEIKLSFYWRALFLLACTPRVELDGIAQKKYWGTHFLATTPGQHKIEVYFRYFLMKKCGANDIEVTVTDGSVTKVRYFMPAWIFAKGSLERVE